jgi:hypothetical protein
MVFVVGQDKTYRDGEKGHSSRNGLHGEGGRRKEEGGRMLKGKARILGKSL